MRILQSLLFLSLIIIVAYLWLFRTPEQIIIRDTHVISEAPIRRLSAFVDMYHDQIFAPLSESETIIAAQEIRQIQATLRKLHSKSQTEYDQKIYSIGTKLCYLLLTAIEEREKHNKRLADSRSKDYSSPLSRPQDKEKDAKQRRAFFERSIYRSWEDTSFRLRIEIGREYDYMRLLEK